MRIWLAVVCLAWSVGSAVEAPAQQAEARIALIIANEAYSGGAFQRLPGTRDDAAVMREALERTGFRVTVRRNLNREAMRDALAEFARSLAALGERGVGFLYYAGHGVGQQGENFLIPVDARVQGVTDLPLQGVPLSEQLEAIQLAGARATIVVLDACRTAFGRGARGLVAIPARTKTLIAFSTQPSELAADDGLYARTLAAEISRPGADTVTAFARVTTIVARVTGDRQIPRYDNGLVDPVTFGLEERRAFPAPVASLTTAREPHQASQLVPAVANAVSRARAAARESGRAMVAVRETVARAQEAERRALAGDRGYVIQDFHEDHGAGVARWVGEELRSGRRVGVWSHDTNQTIGEFEIEVRPRSGKEIQLTRIFPVRHMTRGASGVFEGTGGEGWVWTGAGRFTFPDRSVFEGVWDPRSGVAYGVWAFANGERYEGQLEDIARSGFDLQRHGYGVQWDAGGAALHAGTWNHGDFGTEATR